MQQFTGLKSDTQWPGLTVMRGWILCVHVWTAKFVVQADGAWCYTEKEKLFIAKNGTAQETPTHPDITTADESDAEATQKHILGTSNPNSRGATCHQVTVGMSCNLTYR